MQRGTGRLALAVTMMLSLAFLLISLGPITLGILRSEIHKIMPEEVKVITQDLPGRSR